MAYGWVQEDFIAAKSKIPPTQCPSILYICDTNDQDFIDGRVTALSPSPSLMGSSHMEQGILLYAFAR
jgi:hypothetical protein